MIKNTRQYIIIAGGCFWGMQELFRAQKGVVETEVGYTGGDNEHPTYDHHPGHAEAIKITYDDTTDSATLLDYFFAIHDPTTVNQQGNDRGASYRSAIFYPDEEQKQEAEQAIERNQRHWKKPIVTTLEPLVTFWSAEAEHQDYLQRNPGGYTCHYERSHVAKKRLLFVYNADSGIGNALIDYGKKYISPETYECRLCMVTYGAFGMKKDWKKFVESLPYEAVFLHRDELKTRHADADIALPVVLLETGGTLDVLVSSKDFKNIQTLDRLQEVVSGAISGQ